MNSHSVTLHALVGPGNQAVVGAVAWRLSGDPDLIADAARGLPSGAAHAEAVAARLERAGFPLVWGEPERIGGRTSFVRACHDRGSSSVDVVRADPGLLSNLQVGSFFAGSWKLRPVRRILLALPAGVVVRLLPRIVALRIAADVAFWGGVRAAATEDEWRWLTRSSYVVLYYHRVAGERKVGQERLDVSPRTFERQLRWLRRLRLTAVGPTELSAFHAGRRKSLPRAFVLAADDGFRDAGVALSRHLDMRPFLFVTTAAVGRTATWAQGEAVVSWQELQDLAARGAVVGSHAHHHISLPGLRDDELALELEQSLEEVRSNSAGVPMIAYPHGHTDQRVRAAAAAAGYELGFTTVTGRNGAGTDRLDLRRVGLKEWDGPFAVAWKALTGELVPAPLERLKMHLHGLRRRRHRAARTH